MQTEFIKLAVIFIVIMVMVLAKLKLRDAMIAAILLTVILFGIPLGDAAKLMIQSVYEKDTLLVVSGTGEVIDPDEGVVAIGSGGNYALAAARALVQNADLSAHDIAEKALHIAASICVFTNDNVIVEDV